jgi:hypothetical protein
MVSEAVRRRHLDLMFDPLAAAELSSGVFVPSSQAVCASARKETLRQVTSDDPGV